MDVHQNPYLRGLGGRPVVDDKKQFFEALATVSTPLKQAPKNLPLTTEQVARLEKGSYATDAPNRAQRKQQHKKEQQQAREYERKYGARDRKRAAERAVIEAEYSSQAAITWRYACFHHSLRRSTNPRGSQVVHQLVRH